ncbi:helix-turn-helix domain-containing protein [Chryseobacterium sp.]|uniref:helix-turn-helix domain-containing protein n=1 Tax=Chryseobacterium sp. TaxID=1871047 RepID=UPI0025C10A4F|nr:helix-turn-helix domain-containing protein [Chryseobacterium sp.]MBV8326523.1 AraC family transcriptional regulator [Chryseobacterium sp.]
MKQLSAEYNEWDKIIYLRGTHRDSYRIHTEKDFLSVFLFEKGKGKHQIAHEEYGVHKKKVHLVFPGQLQKLRLEEDALFHLLMIPKVRYAEMISEIHVPLTVCQQYPIIYPSDETFNLLIKEGGDIAFELMDRSCVMHYIIQAKLRIILQSISRTIRRTCRDVQIYEQHPVLFMFIILIRKHFKEERTVSFYAGNLGITANYLNVLCKKHLKKTASGVIDMVIIPMIKQEIMTSDDLLVNIAYDYSFQNYVHFSKYFKKYVGLSPMAYRKQA